MTGCKRCGRKPPEGNDYCRGCEQRLGAEALVILRGAVAGASRRTVGHVGIGAGLAGGRVGTGMHAVRDTVETLGVALSIWSARAAGDPGADAAGDAAVRAIDLLQADLQVMRDELAAEIRARRDTAARTGQA